MVDLGSQFNLRVLTEIAPARGDRGVQEAAVAQTDGDHGSDPAEGQPALQAGDFGSAHRYRLGQVRKRAR